MLSIYFEGHPRSHVKVTLDAQGMLSQYFPIVTMGLSVTICPEYACLWDWQADDIVNCHLWRRPEWQSLVSMATVNNSVCELANVKGRPARVVTVPTMLARTCSCWVSQRHVHVYNAIQRNAVILPEKICSLKFGGKNWGVTWRNWWHQIVAHPWAFVTHICVL